MEDGREVQLLWFTSQVRSESPDSNGCYPLSHSHAYAHVFLPPARGSRARNLLPSQNRLLWRMIFLFLPPCPSRRATA